MHQAAKALISEGVEVNGTDREGKPPLHYAARWLLAHGADVSARTRSGEIPIVIAMRRTHDEVIDAFAEHDARQKAGEQRTTSGPTPSPQDEKPRGQPSDTP